MNKKLEDEKAIDDFVELLKNMVEIPGKRTVMIDGRWFEIDTNFDPPLVKELEEDIPSPYCDVCGHCGEIGCCGVSCFLENHVRGKTNCRYEDEIIDEIEEWFDMEGEKGD